MSARKIPFSDRLATIATIERCARELSACYDSLPPAAKAAALACGHALSKVREQLLVANSTDVLARNSQNRPTVQP